MLTIIMLDFLSSPVNRRDDSKTCSHNGTYQSKYWPVSQTNTHSRERKVNFLNNSFSPLI